jgi:hypothetical protein
MIATLLTLFILPTLYFSLERWVEDRQTRNKPALEGDA